MGVAITKVGLIGFLLGTILGSFIKALADRSLGDRTFWGRSYCPHCKKTLRYYDLLPILSYLYLRGKCRYCHKGIPLEYLLVEVVMGVLVAFIFWQSFANFQFSIFSFQSILNIKFSILLIELVYKIFFVSILAVLFITDIKEMFIPDRIVLPAIKISLVFLCVFTIYKIGYLYYYLSQTSLGRLLLPPESDYFFRHALITGEPLIGSLIMSILIGGFFMVLIIITKGKGMGGGDVKLGALMGLGLGFPNALVATMLAFLLGAVVSIALIILGRKSFGQVIPFGPFLVIGSLIALFWGNQIMNFYLSLSG